MAEITPPGLPADAELLLTAAQIDAGYARLAAAVQPLIAGGDCVLLGVLNGGLFPLVHLAERLEGDFAIHYCHATRYGNATDGTELHWLQRPPAVVASRTVVVVDDIYDAGLTLAAVRQACLEAGAAAVYSAVQVIKDRVRTPAAVAPDFSTGLQVPDRFVFGCGMDYQGRWRHLRAIYALPDAATQGAE